MADVTLSKQIEVIGREDKFGELSDLLGQSSRDEPPSSVFLYGDTATGKSMVLQKCLSHCDYAAAIINCTECYSIRLIFESILNQLANHAMTSDNGYQPYAKCVNTLDFILHLQNLADKFKVGHDGEPSIIIVFDKCERLRSIDKNVIPALVKLRELTSLRVCSILVSLLPWEQFATGDFVTEPLSIFFEQYNQKQLQQILSSKKPENVSQEFYEKFINMFLSMFYSATHDVRELLYQCDICFNHYYDPIKKGDLSENDGGQLWKRCQPFFKKAYRSLYLKVDCSMELSDVENITSVTTQALIMELPYYSKYLLIGAYIASYNPASEDRRLFVKNHGKKKKSTKVKSERAKHHLLGPKPFSLARLFAIVSAILDDDKFNLNADLFVEVGSLVRMKLITQVSEDILDGPSFKCNVGLQFIDVISRNVQFPIRNHLVDFMDV